MIKKELRLPICALVLLSLGGWLLHLRVHPVSFNFANPTNPALFVPFIAGLLSVVVAPLLLNFKGTFIVGYLINGMSVIVGMIAMAAFSLTKLPSPLNAQSIFLGTMLSSIILLFPKLFIGQMILFHYHPNGMGRLFTGFWWLRHFIYLGAIFTLGHFMWR